jgi:hypothetical protein
MRGRAGQNPVGELRLHEGAGTESFSERHSCEGSTLRYATNELLPPDRLSAWREHLSNLLVEVELDPDHPPLAFTSAIVARSLRDLRLLKMTSTTARIVHRAAMVRTPSHSCYMSTSMAWSSFRRSTVS